MSARGDLFRGIAIGIVIGAAVTIAVFQLRGGARPGPCPPAATAPAK